MGEIGKLTNSSFEEFSTGSLFKIYFPKKEHGSSWIGILLNNSYEKYFLILKTSYPQYYYNKIRIPLSGINNCCSFKQISLEEFNYEKIK